MWLTTKYAAKGKKMPPSEIAPMAIRQKQLGVDGAIDYRRLFEAHPDVVRGPDEDLKNHYNRLQKAEREYQNQANPDQERREQARERGMLRTPVLEEKPNQPWVGQLPTGSGGSDLKGMPQRIPGWFTGDAMDAPPPGYGTPPMSRRDPGATMRAPAVPANAPVQTMDEWRKAMGDKGKIVDANGNLQQRRVPAEQPRPRGHDIWRDLVDPPRPEDPASTALRNLPEDQGGLGRGSWMDRAKNFLGRRRASTEVSEYVKGALVDLDGE